MSSNSVTRSISLALVVAGATAVGARAQAPAASAQPRPTFTSGVELISVDVSVVDKAGKPVRNLTAEQFEVTIDGARRRVVSAEVIDYAATAPTTFVPAPDGYSTNEVRKTALAGSRLVFLLVDQGSFSPLGARQAADAARRFIDALTPRDRVGLVAFPAPGPSVAASTRHDVVRESLNRIIGSSQGPDTRPGGANMSLSEAIDIAAGNDAVLQAVIDRECYGSLSAMGRSSASPCRDEINEAALQTGIRAEVQSRHSLGGLHEIVSGLARIPERKTIVLVSAGLAMTDRIGGSADVRAELQNVARDAATANANIYVLHVDSSATDAMAASVRNASATASRDAGILATGLEQLATASGGTLFRAVGRSDFAFERVLDETSVAYVLGVEPIESDRDAKPHPIKVSVAVPNVQVRSRRELVMPRARSAGPETGSDRVTALLRANRQATDLPLGVSTHVLGRSPSGGLRVLIAANVGRGLSGALDAHVGYVVADLSGKAAGAATEDARLMVPSTSARGAAAYATLLGLAPGDYVLRFAVVDPDGRTGSVDHPFSARLEDGNGAAFGDLLLFDPTRTSGEALAPLPDGALAASNIDLYLELYRRDASVPATVVFSVADNDNASPLVEARVAALARDAVRSTAETRLDLSLLPPGEYVAVATAYEGERRIGRRVEPLRLDPVAAKTTSSSAGGAPRVKFELGDSARIVTAFNRRSVLHDEALAYVFARLRAADTGPALTQASDATTAIRDGRFHDALQVLLSAPSDRLSVQMLRGLALLGNDSLEPAAEAFRESLRIADDFLPAAFYLGACYAAGGHDRDAVGAWQTALVTGSDARVIYDVLADAWLRMGKPDEARAIIVEAQGQWPDDASFVPRLAAAQAMQQHRDEALATLAAYLDAHQADTEATALAIRLIYEAHAQGKVAVSADADRVRATQYAARYKAAGGANAALIDRWVAFITKG